MTGTCPGSSVNLPAPQTHIPCWTGFIHGAHARLVLHYASISAAIDEGEM
jgi:hypothetical protein